MRQQTHISTDIRAGKRKRKERIAFFFSVALFLCVAFIVIASSQLAIANAEHDHSSYTALGSVFPTADGDYYLTQSIEISSPISLTNATVTIDLNGFDLVFTGGGKLTVGSAEDEASLTLIGCPTENAGGRVVVASGWTCAASEKAITVAEKGELSAENVAVQVQKDMSRFAALKGVSSWDGVSFAASDGVSLGIALSSEGADVSLRSVSVDAVGAYAVAAADGSQKISVGNYVTAPRGIRLGIGVTIVVASALTEPIGVSSDDALSGVETVVITSAETQKEKERNDLEMFECLLDNGTFYVVTEGAYAGQIAFAKNHVISIYNGVDLVNTLYKQHGVPLLLSAYGLAPSETYRQIGWKVVGEGTVFPLSYSYEEEYDLSLSVVWERFLYSIAYSGSFDLNQNPDYYSIDDGLTLIDPVRAGYVFEGWREDEADDPEIGLTIAPGETGNREFTAVWHLEIYSVTYVNAVNGVNGVTNTNPTFFTIETGEWTVVAPSRVDYDFVNWEGYIAGEDPIVPSGFAEDITLTAVWRPTKYHITYVDAVNGVNGVTNQNPTYYNVESASFTITAPSRKGFDFLYWTKDDETFESVSVPMGSSGNISLTAHWTLYDPIALYASYVGVYDGVSHEVGVQVYHDLSADMTAQYEWWNENGEPAGIPDFTFEVRNVSDSCVLRLHFEISYEDPSSVLYQKSGYVRDYFGRKSLVAQVTPAPLAVTPNGTLTKIYGDPDATIAYAVGAAVGEEQPTLVGALSRESGENVGRYPVTVGTLALASDPVSANYAVDLAPTYYEIEKKALNVFAQTSEIRYGDREIVGRGVRCDGLVEGDTVASLDGTISYSSDYPYLGDVGFYNLTPFGLTSSNYEITFVSGVLEVLPKELFVYWGENEFVYDATVKDFSTFVYAETGIGGGILPLVVREKDGKVVRDAGSYSLVAEKRESNENYVLTNDEMSIDIAKRPLTIRAKDMEIEFGGEVEKFSLLFETFAGKDDVKVLKGELTLECEYVKYDEIAEYPITVSGVTSDNYEITFGVGTLRVLKKEVKIELSTGGGIVGDVAPATATVSGTVENEYVRPSVTYEKDGITTTTVPSEPGTYTVRASIEHEHYKATPHSAPFIVLRDSIQSDQRRQPSGEIQSSTVGINPDAEFTVREIKDTNSETYQRVIEYVSSRETVENVLDLTLLVSGESVSLSGGMTVKITIPKDTIYKNFSVVKIGSSAVEGISYRREGNTIIFETDELTPIAIVTQEDKTTIMWLIIGLVIILSFEIVVGSILIMRDRKKKKKKSKQAKAIAPIFLLSTISLGQFVAVILLSILVVVFGIWDVWLAVHYKKKYKKRKLVAIKSKRF